MADFKKKEILLESGTNELEVMEFTISGNHFGINVAKVVEIMQFKQVTPMPNSNTFVEGVFKPRDDIMTVVDLPTYMGLGRSEQEERDIFIIANFNRINTAFHVHSVVGISRISWTAIEKPHSAIYGGEDGLATGIARYDNRLITIIDFEKILADISPSTSIQIAEIAALGIRERNDKPILIAEDSQLLSKLIRDCLVEAGYSNMHVFSNGKETWEYLSHLKETTEDVTTKIKCIITDIEMPQMDGHRLLKLIRDDDCLKPLPVIIFSSLISEEMKLKGDRLGATAQLAKPEIGNLVNTIDKHILD